MLGSEISDLGKGSLRTRSKYGLVRALHATTKSVSMLISQHTYIASRDVNTFSSVPGREHELQSCRKRLMRWEQGCETNQSLRTKFKPRRRRTRTSFSFLLSP